MKKYLAIALSGFIFFILCISLYFFVHLLNLLPSKSKIITDIVFADILIGLIIYFKTSLDFAIFIGNLIRKKVGFKDRIIIQLGTSFGNGIGTLLILSIWTFLKEVPLILFLMILASSVVLIYLAKGSFLEFKRIRIGKDNQEINTSKNLNKSSLLLLVSSLTLPFILGLDDFAGYIPLFSVVNVFGFCIGVFLGHALLLTGLFASPKLTSKIVSFSIVQLIGGLIFLTIAAFGFIEASKIALSALQILH